MKNSTKPAGYIILKPKKETIFEIRHSWIFSGAISKLEPPHLNNGDWIEVYSFNHRFLGNAFFEKEEQIVARIFDFDAKKIDDFTQYWWNQLDSLFTRKKTLFEDSDAFRFIHSESDECPGVICDIYNQFALIQIDYLYPKELISILSEFLQSKKIESILLKFQNHYQWLTQPSQSFIFQENQIRYKINIKEFQKTGFYLDQKTNRKKLLNYSTNKTILDAFCYTGSFGMNALFYNAKKVVFLDSSKKALKTLKENLILNQLDLNKIQILRENAFQYLEKMESEYFDVIILDPPAFVKNKKDLSSGIKGYIRINELALKKIKKKGILFSFSCSQLVSKEMFRKIIFLAAKKTQRKVVILEYLTQAVDHTTNVFHPQGEYLKGVILYVE
ncbi:MAG: class I SAM-dependent rRNA methyltransferase [Leptonema sp. (in: bacteria)]